MHPEDQKTNLAIIIVTWNKRDLLAGCLESLRAQTFGNFKIIVVDNGSTDGSVEFLRTNYPEVEIVSLNENTGFARGNNVGIEKALGDENIKYVITLNNDTKAEADYIEKMLACAERHPEVGSVQAKVLNFFEKDRIDSAGLLIAPDMGAIERGSGKRDEEVKTEEEIFGPSASATLYRREALEMVALPNGNFFDGDYFLYCEDVDLAWRLRLAGYSSWFCPAARVLHIHGASAKKFSVFQKFYIHRNHYYNIFKNLPLGLMLKALCFMGARYFLIVRAVLEKRGSSAKMIKTEGGGSAVKIIPKVWLEVLKNIPKLIRKRRIIQKKRTVSNGEIKLWFENYGVSLKKSVYGE